MTAKGKITTAGPLLNCVPSQMHWLARDTDPDTATPAQDTETAPAAGGLPTGYNDDPVGDDPAAIYEPEPLPARPRPTRNTSAPVTWAQQASTNGGKTWRTVAVGLDADDVAAIRARNTGGEGTVFRFVDDDGRGAPTTKPAPADGFGPVDAVYAPGDRVSTVDGTGRTSVGVVVEACDPVFKDGRPVQPWDTVYTVRVPNGGETYEDTTGLRRELSIAVGQTWTSTNSRGEPSTMTIGSIEPDGLVVNGVDFKPRGIALSSYAWAQVTSGPHPSTATVRRCDVGGEKLTGPYWLLHGYGRGWLGSRGAACTYHAGQPEPEEAPDAGPAPRDGTTRAMEEHRERIQDAKQPFVSSWADL